MPRMEPVAGEALFEVAGRCSMGRLGKTGTMFVISQNSVTAVRLPVCLAAVAMGWLSYGIIKASVCHARRAKVV